MRNLISLVRSEGVVAGIGWLAYHMGFPAPKHHGGDYNYGWSTAEFEASLSE